jgi:hypothetical protein
VAGAELLQSIINHLFSNEQLVPPVQFEGRDFPVVQYADDTLLILEAIFAHLKS